MLIFHEHLHPTEFSCFIQYILFVGGELPCNPSTKSVSEMAKSKDPLPHPRYPPYCHWFANELYKVYKDAEKKIEDNSLEVYTFQFNEMLFSVTESDLASVVKSIKASCELTQLDCRGISADQDMCDSELAFSSLYARALDRFLFKNPEEGACLHQAPNRVRFSDKTKMDRVDVCAMKFLCNHAPSSPILLADLKNTEMDIAVRETVLYAVNGAHEQRGVKIWPVQIGLPTIHEMSKLMVYIPSDGIVYQLLVAEGKPYDKALLLTVYVAVRSLYEDPIEYEYPITFPLPKKTIKPSMVEPVNHRVFYLEDGGKKYVVKLYDSAEEGWNVPNLELIEQLDYFKEVSLEPICSCDNRLTMMKYSFINAFGNYPRNLKHFTGVLNCLQRLHQKGYIHGDVREQNIIFAKEDSFLIDFDLARKESRESVYPSGYISTHPERHPNAKPQCIMKKEHDVFAIQKVMRKFYQEKMNNIDTFRDIDSLCQWLMEQAV